MDNILYIGPYRELSGMGNAARQYIKALIQTGHNISIRPIYNLFKAYPASQIDNEILELENNFSKSYHSVIQHGYPHQLVYDKRFEKNIGIVHLESIGYRNNSILSNHLNILDKIIVGSNFVKNSIIYAGVDANKINVIPEPIDLHMINKYKELNENKKTINDKFAFYTICDFINRKNLEKIIMAYSLAFNDNDNAELVIKLKSFANTDIYFQENIEYKLDKIYRILRRNTFKKPKILFGDIEYEGILYIHNNNNCFLNASSGESFGYSTLEAMAFNNNIIVNDNIGSTEILSENCGLILKNKQNYCLDEDRLYYQYNTIDNLWYEPDMNSIINNMHKAYNESAIEKQQRINTQNIQLQKFSIDNVTQQFISI